MLAFHLWNMTKCITFSFKHLNIFCKYTVPSLLEYSQRTMSKCTAQFSTSLRAQLSVSLTVKVGSSLRIRSHSVCTKQLQQPASTKKQLTQISKKWKQKQNWNKAQSTVTPQVVSSSLWQHSHHNYSTLDLGQRREVEPSLTWSASKHESSLPPKCIQYVKRST